MKSTGIGKISLFHVRDTIGVDCSKGLTQFVSVSSVIFQEIGVILLEGGVLVVFLVFTTSFTERMLN
jgi:hypothetical protein